MFTLKDDQAVELKLHCLDAAGNDAVFAGPPTWTLNGPPDLVNLQVAADGMSALASAAGKLGRGSVVVTVPIAMGGGISLTDTFEFEVSADRAKSLNIVPGEPTSLADAPTAPPVRVVIVPEPVPAPSPSS